MDDAFNTISDVGQAVEISARIFQSLQKIIGVFDSKSSSSKETNITNSDFMELSRFARDALVDATRMHQVLIEKDTRIRELEIELSRQNDWNQDKHRYSLKPISAMSFAYCLKNEYISEEEPVHLLCVNCASNSIKSLLHKVSLLDSSRLQCPRCEQFFAFSYNYMTKGN